MKEILGIGKVRVIPMEITGGSSVAMLKDFLQLNVKMSKI